MHPTPPRPCRVSFTGSDDPLLFSRLTQRLAPSPAGDPLLFSRHAQKPAPRYLAGNLASYGSDESGGHGAGGRGLHPAWVGGPPRAAHPRDRGQDRVRGQVGGQEEGRRGCGCRRGGKGPGRRTPPDWTCVNRRDRYCMRYTLFHSVLVDNRKLSKGESNAGFRTLGGAPQGL